MVTIGKTLTLHFILPGIIIYQEVQPPVTWCMISILDKLIFTIDVSMQIPPSSRARSASCSNASEANSVVETSPNAEIQSQAPPT